MTEIWKPIKDYPKYEVSNLGRVKSFQKKDSLILKPRNNLRGYLMVGLCNENGAKTRSIHRIVLETFVGFRPKGYECCHANGIKADNSLENLRWDSAENNMKDKIKHGRMRKKLNEEMVYRIREYLKNGISLRKIASLFGVCHKTIIMIKKKQTWAHI